MLRAADMRILIVDDYEDAAASLAELLTALGHDVRTAPDGPSALDLVRSFSPTRCLIDVDLPIMDGYEVARQLRQLEGALGNIRLIALTGYGRESDRLRSQEAGFDGYMVKPIDLEILANVLRD